MTHRRQKKMQKIKYQPRRANVRSKGWFRSTDLWVMSPALFLWATLLWMDDEVAVAILTQELANHVTNTFVRDV